MKSSRFITQVLVLRGHQPRVPWHAHDSLIVALNVRGKREMRVNNEQAALSRNTPYIISPGDVHSISAVKNRAYCGIVIVIGPHAIRSLKKRLSFSRLPVFSPVYKRLIPLIAAIADYGIDNTQIKKILSIVSRVPKRPFDVIEERMKAARLLLGADLENKIGIAQAARAAGLSRFHFIRTFKKAFGVTPHAYRNILRVQKAKALLRQDSAQSDCALECGFSDQSHLHRNFRRQVGFLPSAYTRSK